MVTSDNFDIYPVAKSKVQFRTFDMLKGFNPKKKKKIVKEEWDPEKGVYIDDKKIAQEKAKAKFDEIKKTAPIRNLDKNPIRRDPLKKDTVYSVGEIARFVYSMNPKFGDITVQGKWDNAKEFENDLRKSKSLREKADKYMVAKKGKEKAVAPVKDENYEVFDLARKLAEKKDHPAIKALIGDTSEPSLRRMIAKDPNSAKMLNRVLQNIK